MVFLHTMPLHQQKLQVTYKDLMVFVMVTQQENAETLEELYVKTRSEGFGSEVKDVLY